MTELIQAAFSAVGILPTALLFFVTLYWVAVISGLLDLDFLDIEIEADLNLETEADGASSVAWLNNALGFFNLGKVPLMVFLTFLALPFWIITLLAIHYLQLESVVAGWAMLVPAFVAALFISKVFTTPFVKLFAALEKEHASKETIIGQVCTVVLPASDAELGQAAVKTAGAPLLLNVRATTGQSLLKGQSALVIDYNAENKIYLIEPYETI
ncbi:OB-fold-containig protein [Botryobacter ruber]|uniref:OB-fold-containig protein n=1 Tax=Botryobacter ruber TaxID=2171629 RepID=UPI000E0BBAB7|nr:OB-fold-containig protein [Botryobacter ruber]